MIHYLKVNGKESFLSNTVLLSGFNIKKQKLKINEPCIHLKNQKNVLKLIKRNQEADVNKGKIVLVEQKAQETNKVVRQKLAASSLGVGEIYFNRQMHDQLD